MGLVRFGTGRDAADVAFATIFGSVTSLATTHHDARRHRWSYSAAHAVPRPASAFDR